MPLKSKEQQKKVPCPHCQYENSEGAQFCVMCQKPLTVIKPPQPPAEPTQTQEAPPSKREAPPSKEEAFDLSGLPLQAKERRKPRLSFREIATSLQDDINTMENTFSWFTQFYRVMRILGFIFSVGGLLLGAYIRFAMDAPPPPEVLTTGQRWMYAGISIGVGFFLWLACIVVSNIIALTLEIERNTKVTTLLLQKLVEKEEE